MLHDFTVSCCKCGCQCLSCAWLVQSPRITGDSKVHDQIWNLTHGHQHLCLIIVMLSTGEGECT
jgi:hypothetical protein